MNLTETIKDFALSIGYDRVGVASVEDFTFFREQVEARPEMYEWAVQGFMQVLSGVSPTRVMPSARSIIVTITDLLKESFPDSLVGSIGRLYLARFFKSQRYVVHSVRLKLMRDFLQEQGLTIEKRMTIPARQSAVRAGLATFGRNNFAFAEGLGSYFGITTFLVDADLDHDEPTFSAPCPEGCRLCVDACPSGSLYEPFHMDPRKCVAYVSYAGTGLVEGRTPGSIPLSMRKKMGRWIYGCDACQDVCPRSRAKLKVKPPVDAYMASVAGNLTPSALLNLSDEHFTERVLPVLYYIYEKKYYQRNAAVAIGNAGDRKGVPSLIQALSDPEPLVRGHSAWALGELGGKNARLALEAGRGRESDPETLREIETALARL